MVASVYIDNSTVVENMIMVKQLFDNLYRFIRSSEEPTTLYVPLISGDIKHLHAINILVINSKLIIIRLNFGSVFENISPS